MHHAPALTLTLQPDRLWLAGLCALGGTALLTTLGWLAWHAAHTGLPDAARLACGAVSTLPALALLRQAAAARAVAGATLAWQPAQGLWLLQQETARRPGRLRCLVAGQDWLLLCHSAAGVGATWLPLSRSAHAEQWHALRCAVFSPGTVTAAPTAAPARPDE